MNEIFTIGYGGRDMDEFLRLLDRYRIDTLVDVRSQPYSKFSPDFSKANLIHALRRSGIKYAFMGDALGGRQADRSCYRYSPQRKKAVLDHKLCETKAPYRQAIAQLRLRLHDGSRIALMCSELEPRECHRGYVLGKSLDGADIAVAHIGKHGEKLSQAQIPDMTYQEALL